MINIDYFSNYSSHVIGYSLTREKKERLLNLAGLVYFP